MRKLNLVFLTCLVTATLALSGAVYIVHGRQVQRNASALLDRAHKDEQQGQAAKAVEEMRQYLSLRPHDGEAWRSYARLLDETTKDSRRRDQVYLVSEEALRQNPADPTLERRCVDLALEVRPERTADAKRHLKVLLTQAEEKLEKDTEVASAAIELAELKELEGKCLLVESDFQAAATAFNEAISYDPTRLGCYIQLARLERNELRKDPRDADGDIQWMVANNPESGLAHLNRFQYAAEFRPPAADSDLKRALELSPENPEVLLTAALVAEQKNDPAAARTYLEQGLKLHPQNAGFPLALARLELGEQHRDRAEAVLRQAYQAKPSVDLAFLLAEMLILEDKVDGEDGAGVLINFLSDRGFRETYARYLEARIEVRAKRWEKAIAKIEPARTVHESRPPNHHPARPACWPNATPGLGWEEQRLDALRNAGRGPLGVGIGPHRAGRGLGPSGQARPGGHDPRAAGDAQARVAARSRASPDPEDESPAQEPAELAGSGAAPARGREGTPAGRRAVDLLRVDLLAAQGRLEDARSLLSSVQAKDPRNLQYRLALARLTQRQGKGPSALQILDQAEKDLGPSLDIQLARLDYWGLEGGDAAKAAVAKLAETRQQIPAADRPAFLDRLGRDRDPARRIGPGAAILARAGGPPAG